MKRKVSMYQSPEKLSSAMMTSEMSTMRMKRILLRVLISLSTRPVLERFVHDTHPARAESTDDGERTNTLGDVGALRLAGAPAGGEGLGLQAQHLVGPRLGARAGAPPGARGPGDHVGAERQVRQLHLHRGRRGCV